MTEFTERKFYFARQRHSEDVDYIKYLEGKLILADQRRIKKHGQVERKVTAKVDEIKNLSAKVARLKEQIVLDKRYIRSLEEIIRIDNSVLLILVIILMAVLVASLFLWSKTL